MTKKVLKMKLEKLPPKTFLMQLRRGRWKIENYGFKEQKSDVLNITNMYTKKMQQHKKYLFNNSICTYHFKFIKLWKRFNYWFEYNKKRSK